MVAHSERGTKNPRRVKKIHEPLIITDFFYFDKVYEKNLRRERRSSSNNDIETKKTHPANSLQNGLFEPGSVLDDQSRTAMQLHHNFLTSCAE